MLEMPEAITIARQLNEKVVGKVIAQALENTGNDRTSQYFATLPGKTIDGALSFGGQPEIHVGNLVMSVNDGVNIRYYPPEKKRPEKYLLILELADGDAVVYTVQMYGGLQCFPVGTNDNFFYVVAKEKPSPLTDAFDLPYFLSLLTQDAKKLSAKAFLATEQRIPGLGNGALQDILWEAKIHPKKKMGSLSDGELRAMFSAVKFVMSAMTEKGGRDTEKDLFGNWGGYATVMSKKTVGKPCPACGNAVERMAYMGGNVYVCETCQKK